METVEQSTFVIIRDDRGVDAKKLVSDGVTIGQKADAHIWLNHTNVSPLHAGINRIGANFYLTNLSPSYATMLNGRMIPVKDSEVLIAGDEIQIGPFFLRINDINPLSRTLEIAVRLQFALGIGVPRPAHKQEVYEKQRAKKRITAPLELPRNSLQIFWDSRTGEKAGQRTPLHPRTLRSGKARYNWMPTRDLIRPWPFAIFMLAAIAIATLSSIAAFAYKGAFAPEPISKPHTRNTFAVTPAIAKQSNGDSCMNCHAIGVSVSNKTKMNAKCESCHTTESFVADIIPAHREAGLTCMTCHTEHRGRDFRPIREALESCRKCHDNANKTDFNGKKVHTPHDGTYGYPVINGVWVWKGLDADELAQKPAIVALLKQNRVTPSEEQKWRNVEFHGLHVDRIRIVPGIDESEEGDRTNKVLSCRSCHKAGYDIANPDRTNPRTTCALCHSTQASNEAPFSAAVNAPSCTSCHVQHVRDTHWSSNLVIDQPKESDSEIRK